VCILVATRPVDFRRGSGALPDHLPRVHVTIEPKDTDCPCCRAAMHVISEETSQRLDAIRAQYRVIVTHRPKCRCGPASCHALGRLQGADRRPLYQRTRSDCG
jgi:transposase